MKTQDLDLDIEYVFRAKEIYDKIMQNKNRGVPFFLLRVGDGETIMMCPDKKEWKHDYDRMCHNHLGYVLEEQDGIYIKNIIEESILNADVLGLAPKSHREKNVFWDEQHALVKNLQSKNEANTTIAVKYCSLDIHIHLLECGLLNKILSKIDEVVIISSRDLKNDISERYPNLKNIEYYLTPGEYAYEENGEKSKLYPELYTDIVRKIYEKDRKGQICLFGAGFIGKGFGSHFKKAGGIALDIGSVFDLWEGKRTRGPGKGKTAKNLKFTLQKNKIKDHYKSLESVKINGYRAAQHKDFYTVFNPFLKLYKFTHILEIGTYQGGLTMYLRSRTSPNTKILSYDIKEFSEHESLRKQNIDIRIQNIFNKNYTEINDEYVLNFLKETGRKLILCDGNNKSAEFNCLAKYLNVGDFIMAHDYSFSKSYFEKNIQYQVWSHCEIIEEDIFQSSIDNKLIHYNYNQFQNIAWVCKTKIK